MYMYVYDSGLHVHVRPEQGFGTSLSFPFPPFSLRLSFPSSPPYLPPSLYSSSSSLSLAQLSQVGVLSKAVGMGTYVDSQWGLAQFSLPSEVPCLCAFLPDRKSVIGEQHTAAGIPVKIVILS